MGARRRPSFVFKLLLAIPVFCMTTALLFIFGSSDWHGNQVIKKISRQDLPTSKQVESVILPPPLLKIDTFDQSIITVINEIGNLNQINVNDYHQRKNSNKNVEIDLKVKIDQEKSIDNQSIDAARVANLPQPKRFVADPENPIYKVNDLQQPGQFGLPVSIDTKLLSPAERKKYHDGWKRNQFNQYASDMISVHRILPAPPYFAECSKENKPLLDLSPLAASVIICFHNEAWSVLLRTVHSVIERTPSSLLKEIILVDDFSNFDHLKQPLNDYMQQFPLVKIVRLTQRQGLIRARLRGAEAAKGRVLTFLDSHCECMDGWLEPLLTRIQAKKHTVASPVIDIINMTTFQYQGTSKNRPIYIGDFDWSLDFNWRLLPEKQREGRKPFDPVPTPTIAGGIFAIEKSFFEYLGTYDPGLDIWGAENLEMSFKVWMCGNGSLEILPCSRVGHIFRDKSPYSWRPGVDVLKRNKIRVAEVWMDEYKHYFYERLNDNLGDFGNVSDRLSLRQKIKCHSFHWYLQNVFPDLQIPPPAVAKGEIRNLDAARCLDSHVGRRQPRDRMVARHCTQQGESQFWIYSEDGEIRRDDSCVSYDQRFNEIIGRPCEKDFDEQKWYYDHYQHYILHVKTQKCFELAENGVVRLNQCSNSPNQKWSFQYFYQGVSVKTKIG